MRNFIYKKANETDRKLLSKDPVFRTEKSSYFHRMTAKRQRDLKEEIEQEKRALELDQKRREIQQLVEEKKAIQQDVISRQLQLRIQMHLQQVAHHNELQVMQERVADYQQRLRESHHHFMQQQLQNERNAITLLNVTHTLEKERFKEHIEHRENQLMLKRARIAYEIAAKPQHRKSILNSSHA